MLIQNLNFFDKFGKNLNLVQNPNTGVWEGRIFFKEISKYLFDNENLFILEKIGTQYKFPSLLPGEKLEFEWSSNQNESVFFIYDVETDQQMGERFISKVDGKTVKHSDINLNNSISAIDLRTPLQINIAFSPADEFEYTRSLNIYLGSDSSNNRTKIAELEFYGEGIEEDTRFADWAQNFGIKFLREDANILKDYDIKEAVPNLSDLNRARKELLVSKEHVYPYIGTYKGLSNFINLLGYKDTLQIKEYWNNINPKSSYFNKLLMIDISDYLDDGKIDTFDLVDRNRGVKEGKQFKKTEFLALVYQFTKESGSFDDDGIPEIEETTQFSVNEIFYKLNKLNDKLKNEFLPVNVKIRDIIGEFIYFQKLTINYWTDSTQIFDYDLNENASISVYPGKNVNLVLRSLDPLYRQVNPNGIDFGADRINQSAKNPFEFDQKYTKTDNIQLANTIESFYSSIAQQSYPNIGKRLSWELGDDPEKTIGAPIILTVDAGKFTLSDLKGVKLEDLDSNLQSTDPYWTLENIDFRNFYEISWKITKAAPNPYQFEYRGKISDLFKLAHVLPYAGDYRVTAELYDFYGNISVFSKIIKVQADLFPEIVAFTRLEDKFDYSIKNLKNVQLKDFGSSALYYPKVNVLYNESSSVKIDIYKQLLEWSSFYKNRYGMGQNLYDVEVFNALTNSYVNYSELSSADPRKRYWGLGENEAPFKLNDFRDIEIGSLYWLRLQNLIFLDDFNAGFYLAIPKPGKSIKISLFSDYIVPNYSSESELLEILNSSDHPGIKLFNYEIIKDKKKKNKKVIHAQANYLSKEMYHILDLPGESSPASSPSPSPSTGRSSDKYTFFLPRGVFSKSLVKYLESLSPVFDEETLFLLAKTSDILRGSVQEPSFWIETKYWDFNDDLQVGHLPTLLDQNAFNINDIKLFEETFNIPENSPVFFVINNLDGKREFIWKLTNYRTGEQIIQTRSTPFFCWKFKDLGEFTLSVEIIDNRGTSYSSEVKNFIRVLDKKEYVNYVERKLNDRKIELTRNKRII